MRSKYIQRHSHSCLEDSIVKSWLVQLVLSFEVKKCESSTLFFFFLKKKKKKAIPHLPWVTGYSPPTHRHSTEEARRWLSPTDPPSFPESQCPRGTLLLSFFKSSQVAPSGACGGAAWTEAAALASAAGSGRQARVCTSLSAHWPGIRELCSGLPLIWPACCQVSIRQPVNTVGSGTSAEKNKSDDGLKEEWVPDLDIWRGQEEPPPLAWVPQQRAHGAVLWNEVSERSLGSSFPAFRHCLTNANWPNKREVLAFPGRDQNKHPPLCLQHSREEGGVLAAEAVGRALPLGSTCLCQLLRSVLSIQRICGITVH